MAELFGFEIKRKGQDKEENKKSFVAPLENDGSTYIQSAGGHFGSYVDMGGDTGTAEQDLIKRYRDVATQPECDSAIEDIVNEAIVADTDAAPIELLTDNLDQPDNIKKLIREEFTNIIELLQFNNYGHDIFRRWYVDGRLFYHIIVDEKSPKKGILELRSIDPIKIKKVKEVETIKDNATGVDLIKEIDEYYLYQDSSLSNSNAGIKISKDAIQYTTSGLLDVSRKKILSHLQKAIKPVNQLRMMEDSLVIYRLSRAPERRIFYIDVGNLPKGKAEEYVKGIMNNYHNKLVYDASTGELKDDRKHMSMLEDFWLPRREGGRGTEITTLPGGENLGQIDDIIYFQKRMYRSLNVPISRLEPDQAAGILGRSTEINRDELKFQKFIDRIRTRFAHLFYGILRKQLILKGILTEEDWDMFKNDITLDYVKDNHFAELRDAEMMQNRFQMLDQAANYVGEYYSKNWVMKNILMLSDEDIENMKKEMDEEEKGGEMDNQEPPEQEIPDEEPQDDEESQGEDDE